MNGAAISGFTGTGEIFGKLRQTSAFASAAGRCRLDLGKPIRFHPDTLTVSMFPCFRPERLLSLSGKLGRRLENGEEKLKTNSAYFHH